ncbi:hypothetical protein Gpo141_00006786 [Globisporangium polare]
MSSGTNAKRAGSTSQVWGYVIVLGAALAFILSMYMMFFSKLLLYIDDPSDTKALSAIAIAAAANDPVHVQEVAVGVLRAIELDVYYCYLLPLTIPVSFLAFYANWVSLKFFRHN